MKEDTKKDIIQYFSKRLNDEINLLEATIFQDINKVKQEASDRDLLRSGITLNSISDTIINNTVSSCIEKLEFIDTFQDYMKFKIHERQLGEIEEVYLSLYVPFLKNKFEKTYIEHVKSIFGDSELHMGEKYKLDTSIQKLKTMIKNKVEDVIIKNRLQKDEPSVRFSKYANIISLISLIASLFASIFSVFYGK